MTATKIKASMKGLFILLTVSNLVAGDFNCKIIDTDTDSDLIQACQKQDSKRPWACFCATTEECEDSDSDQKQIFHRRYFLGCGTLSDCGFSTPYGQQCRAMEN